MPVKDCFFHPMLLTKRVKLAKLLSVQTTKSERSISVDVKKGHDKTEDCVFGYKRYLLCVLKQSSVDAVSLYQMLLTGS